MNRRRNQWGRSRIALITGIALVTAAVPVAINIAGGGGGGGGGGGCTAYNSGIAGFPCPTSAGGSAGVPFGTSLQMTMCNALAGGGNLPCGALDPSTHAQLTGDLCNVCPPQVASSPGGNCQLSASKPICWDAANGFGMYGPGFGADCSTITPVVINGWTFTTGISMNCGNGTTCTVATSCPTAELTLQSSKVYGCACTSGASGPLLVKNTEIIGNNAGQTGGAWCPNGALGANDPDHCPRGMSGANWYADSVFIHGFAAFGAGAYSNTAMSNSVVRDADCQAYCSDDPSVPGSFPMCNNGLTPTTVTATDNGKTGNAIVSQGLLHVVVAAGPLTEPITVAASNGGHIFFSVNGHTGGYQVTAVTGGTDPAGQAVSAGTAGAYTVSTGASVRSANVDPCNIHTAALETNDVGANITNVNLTGNVFSCNWIINPVNGGCSATLALYAQTHTLGPIMVASNMMTDSGGVSNCVQFAGGQPPYDGGVNATFKNNVWNRSAPACGGAGSAFDGNDWSVSYAAAHNNKWCNNKFSDGVAVLVAGVNPETGGCP